MERRTRRLITLISAGRNRIIVIRRELPLTENADCVRGRYRTEDRRILLSVGLPSVTCAAAVMSLSEVSQACRRQPAIPSSQCLSASATGPVKAARSAPKGSLDGWRRCGSSSEEGMAGILHVHAAIHAATALCGRWRASTWTAMAQMNPSISRPTAVTICGLFLPRASSFL